MSRHGASNRGVKMVVLNFNGGQKSSSTPKVHTCDSLGFPSNSNSFMFSSTPKVHTFDTPNSHQYIFMFSVATLLSMGLLILPYCKKK
uniref:Uncharacterized protein n=1 Tax=Nelumbo nucifera TaxID=4432 RepID=A0A822YKD8_NELNU|nr:TPA_asm: hypothetical protein HUJ06_031286 [Nelumbo nucifera]